MLEELIGRLDRMLLASPLDDTTMIAVEPGDLREIRDALERSNSRLGEGMVEREAVARIIKGARLSAAFGREFRAGDGRLDDVDLDAADAIITALSAPPPPVGEVERIEPEEAAWAWMEVTFPAPTDQDYSADEMVDAFLAGLERAAALSNPVDSGEVEQLRTAISNVPMDQPVRLSSGKVACAVPTKEQTEAILKAVLSVIGAPGNNLRVALEPAMARLADLERDGMPAGLDPLADEDAITVSIGELRAIRAALNAPTSGERE